MDFGIISLGNHAMTRIIPAIKESGSRVTHIYSRDREKGELISRELGAEYFPDLESFYRQPFEAAYISSPNSLHFINAKRSMENGKSVLLEKPVTLRVEDTDTLISIARRENLRFGVGFHLRFHPSVEAILQTLSEGKIGEARVVYGKFSSNSPNTSRKGTWWDSPEMAGGGSIAGRGVHVMDSFVNFFGRDIKYVSAFNIPPCSVVEDTMFVSIRFSSGLIANSLSSRLITSDSNDLIIYGSEGSIVVTNFYSTSVSSTLLINNQKIREYRGETNMYAEEIKDFAGEFKKIAGPEDALISTKLHLFSQKSACSGKWVEV